MRPLEDVRVIAIEQYGAGPFATVHLADMGAEIIKIEEPSRGGDVGRYVPPFQEDEDSLFFETFNRNKRSLSLDLRKPSGRAVFEDLVRVSDIVFSNLRGDVPEELRIRYRDLAHLNPAIVCCSLTGFGLTGPRRAEPGYDYILQGLAGWMSLTGEPEGLPSKSGISLVDYSAGFVAAITMLTALHAARRDGVGADCDISLFDTAVTMLTYQATWYLTKGLTTGRTRHSSHPSLVPFQNFQTSDGWIVVACGKEKFWQRFAEAIGRPELARDERYDSFDRRRTNADSLLLILAGVLLTRTSADWLLTLAAAGVPCSPVNSIAEALDDGHTAARGLIVETQHPRFGTVRQPASPVRVGDQPVEHRPAPRRNEACGYVLRDLLGYDDDRITPLKESGAFGVDAAVEHS